MRMTFVFAGGMVERRGGGTFTRGMFVFACMSVCLFVYDIHGVALYRIINKQALAFVFKLTSTNTPKNKFTEKPIGEKCFAEVSRKQTGIEQII